MMKASRTLSITLLAASLCAPLVADRAATISGTISLPQGRKAPAEGIGLNLTVIVSDFDGPESSLWVVIPSGENSTSFSMPVPPSTSSKFRLRFFNHSAGYMRSGYWSKTGTVPFRADGPQLWLDVSRGPVAGIKLVIPPDDNVIDYGESKRQAEDEARRMVSKITKPHFTEFEKALAIHDFLLDRLNYYSDAVADARRLQGINDTYHCTALRAGVAVCDGYADLFMVMAKQAGLECRVISVSHTHAWNEVRIDGRFWHVDLSYDDHKSSYERFLLSDAQFEAATEKPILWPHPHAPKRADDSFHYTSAMTPHLAEMPGSAVHRLFGTIRLPAGETAPIGGVTIAVNDAQWTFIPPGQNRAFFALRIPINDPALKINTLQFKVSGRSLPYIARTWYNSATGLVPDRHQATTIDLAGPDHNNIDVTLPRGTEVSGEFRLPPGMGAPSGGASVNLDVFTENDNVSSFQYRIPAGQSALRFSERLPPQAAAQGVIIRFGFSTGEESLQAAGGYYGGATGAACCWEDGQRLRVGRDALTGLVLQFKPAFALTGVVSLPAGVPALDRDFEFKLGVHRLAQNGGVRHWRKSFVIKAGERDANFRMRMLPETGIRGYKISLLDESGRFTPEIFFRRGTPAVTNDEADVLTPHTGDCPNINFVFKQK